MVRGQSHKTCQSSDTKCVITHAGMTTPSSNIVEMLISQTRSVRSEKINVTMLVHTFNVIEDKNHETLKYMQRFCISRILTAADKNRYQARHQVISMSENPPARSPGCTFFLQKVDNLILVVALKTQAANAVSPSK